MNWLSFLDSEHQYVCIKSLPWFLLDKFVGLQGNVTTYKEFKILSLSTSSTTAKKVTTATQTSSRTIWSPFRPISDHFRHQNWEVTIFFSAFGRPPHPWFGILVPPPPASGFRAHSRWLPECPVFLNFSWEVQDPRTEVTVSETWVLTEVWYRDSISLGRGRRRLLQVDGYLM